MNEDVLEKTKAMLKETADSMGIELLSVKFLQNGDNGPTLEVLIDKDYSIDMATIQSFTDSVNPKLDKIDNLPDNYVLDIASGGNEREIPLSDLGKLKDRYLDLVLKDGEKITAKLVEADKDSFTVLYFIKGRKKERTVANADAVSIHMGYKA
ncbi:MAG: hypothetical protein LKE52_02510 [Bacilli bacterium]|jgi:ribosome maturation factor RimP|nr:hypothetical protein [Bacilli bacterium]